MFLRGLQTCFTYISGCRFIYLISGYWLWLFLYMFQDTNYTILLTTYFWLNVYRFVTVYMFLFTYFWLNVYTFVATCLQLFTGACTFTGEYFELFQANMFTNTNFCQHHFYMILATCLQIYNCWTPLNHQQNFKLA